MFYNFDLSHFTHDHHHQLFRETCSLLLVILWAYITDEPTDTNYTCLHGEMNLHIFVCARYFLLVFSITKLRDCTCTSVIVVVKCFCLVFVYPVTQSQQSTSSTSLETKLSNTCHSDMVGHYSMYYVYMLNIFPQLPYMFLYKHRFLNYTNIGI